MLAYVPFKDTTLHTNHITNIHHKGENIVENAFGIPKENLP